MSADTTATLTHLPLLQAQWRVEEVGQPGTTNCQRVVARDGRTVLWVKHQGKNEHANVAHLAAAAPDLRDASAGALKVIEDLTRLVRAIRNGTVSEAKQLADLRQFSLNSDLNTGLIAGRLREALKSAAPE